MGDWKKIEIRDNNGNLETKYIKETDVKDNEVPKYLFNSSNTFPKPLKVNNYFFNITLLVSFSLFVAIGIITKNNILALITSAITSFLFQIILYIFLAYMPIILSVILSVGFSMLIFEISGHIYWGVTVGIISLLFIFYFYFDKHIKDWKGKKEEPKIKENICSYEYFKKITKDSDVFLDLRSNAESFKKGNKICESCINVEPFFDRPFIYCYLCENHGDPIERRIKYKNELAVLIPADILTDCRKNDSESIIEGIPVICNKGNQKDAIDRLKRATKYCMPEELAYFKYIIKEIRINENIEKWINFIKTDNGKYIIELSSKGNFSKMNFDIVDFIREVSGVHYELNFARNNIYIKEVLKQNQRAMKEAKDGGAK
jgi:hypothetical protein